MNVNPHKTMLEQPLSAYTAFSGVDGRIFYNRNKGRVAAVVIKLSPTNESYEQATHAYLMFTVHGTKKTSHWLFKSVPEHVISLALFDWLLVKMSTQEVLKYVRKHAEKINPFTEMRDLE